MPDIFGTPTCSECGQTGDRYYRGFSGLCIDCHETPEDSYDYYDAEDASEHPDESGIHSWDYKPTPRFYGSGPYHMGFELEISADTYNTTPIYRWAETHNCEGLFYVKEDGSVSGFEIVTHPMSREYFDRVDWKDFFGMLEAHWPMNGADESNGHGLHVHVSREAFPHKSTLARWSFLMNRNQSHVNRVARRTRSRWAEFTEYPVSACLPYDSDSRRGRWVTVPDSMLECGCCYERTWEEPRLSSRITRQFQNRVSQGRYAALNLTNEHTVEVRVFRSTRKAEELISSIHFVAAMVDFVREMQPWHATKDATSWERFGEYVKAHPVFSADAPVFLGMPVEEPPETTEVMARLGRQRNVRQWLRDNGYDVGSRGRISAHHHSIYEAAHNQQGFQIGDVVRLTVANNLSDEWLGMRARVLDSNDGIYVPTYPQDAVWLRPIDARPDGLTSDFWWYDANGGSGVELVPADQVDFQTYFDILASL